MKPWWKSDHDWLMVQNSPHYHIITPSFSPQPFIHSFLPSFPQSFPQQPFSTPTPLSPRAILLLYRIVSRAQLHQGTLPSIILWQHTPCSEDRSSLQLSGHFSWRAYNTSTWLMAYLEHQTWLHLLQALLDIEYLQCHWLREHWRTEIVLPHDSVEVLPEEGAVSLAWSTPSGFLVGAEDGFEDRQTGFQHLQDTHEVHLILIQLLSHTHTLIYA